MSMTDTLSSLGMISHCQFYQFLRSLTFRDNPTLEHFPYYYEPSNGGYVGLFLRKRPAERFSLVYTLREIL